MATQLLEDGDVSFELGMDSNSHPEKLSPGRYGRSENMTNRGGIIQCRPGYRCLMAAPSGNFQGFFIFKPKVGSEVMLFGVDGILYKSDYPFRSFQVVPGVSMSSTARQFYWQQVEQTVARNADGSLRIIDPRSLLVIEDGGFTPAILYDGTTAEHQRGAGKIPIGGDMKWIGGRLWVARDDLLFASDLNNPISFIEQFYPGNVQAFILPDIITALSVTPTSTTEVPQLLVFTEETTSLIQAGVQDRTLWTVTPDMQKLLLSNIGCRSSRSLVETSGFLWWYASQGLISMDQALNARRSSRLPYRDSEMIESKARLSEDLTGVASGSYENYLLVSVPFADLFNRHTWVMDQLPRESLNEESAPAWNSVWTGTRPIQWITMSVRGKMRVFYISFDYDGVNRVWEAFTPDRLDNWCPISWWFETRAYIGQREYELRNKTFKFADIYATEMLDVVDVGAYWAGANRGHYKQIFKKRFIATRGCFRPGIQISMQSKIYAFKKQSRTIRTQDGKELDSTYSFSSCGVEDSWEEFYDRSFQLLVAGSGNFACSSIKLYMEPPRPQDILESHDVCEDETDENVVRFDGAAADSHNEEDAWKELETAPTEFLSVQMVTASRDGFSEVGTGRGRSIVSQQDADKIAQRAALRLAARQLEDDLPRIVSLGQ
jgi:hypothetical protein